MRKADNLPPYRAVVMKSGSLNFLEPSGPAQASYGRTLPLPFTPSEGYSKSSDELLNNKAILQRKMYYILREEDFKVTYQGETFI